ncbi:MAG: hypothetical protein ACFFD8_08940 [Candidatus Thorarchaeota archaeon]
MGGLAKVDLACIGFMVVIILIGSGYLAIFAGWVLIGPILIWVGWIWWIVIALVIVSLLIMVWTVRKQRN